MVIFHSYVSLPEGISWCIISFTIRMAISGGERCHLQQLNMALRWPCSCCDWVGEPTGTPTGWDNQLLQMIRYWLDAKDMSLWRIYKYVTMYIYIYKVRKWRVGLCSCRICVKHKGWWGLRTHEAFDLYVWVRKIGGFHPRSTLPSYMVHLQLHLGRNSNWCHEPNPKPFLKKLVWSPWSFGHWTYLETVIFFWALPHSRNGIDCLGPPRPGTGGICRGASDLGVAARRVGKPQHGEAEGLGALLGSGWFGTMEFYDFPFSWECHHPNWLSYFSEG